MHREQFAELFTWIWELWCQYGDDEYEFKYFGKDAQAPQRPGQQGQPEGETIKISKEELQGKYKIVVRGNDQNTNPKVRLEKAQMILQAALNPIALQTGVVTPIHLANAYKRFYQELDIQDWENFVNIQPQPPQPGADIQPQFDDLEDGEQAQVLARKGIQPDMQGRMLKKNLEIQEANAKYEKKNEKARSGNRKKK